MGWVWWGSWVGLRCGSGSGWEGVGCVCLWDSVRSVFDMVEGRVGLVGVELTREWSWVGWMLGRYGGCEFVLGGESAVWRAVRMR